MTPKEKAEALVYRYNESLTYLESRVKAKECALICVQEIIEATADDWTHNDFWLEVKKELLK